MSDWLLTRLGFTYPHRRVSDGLNLFSQPLHLIRALFSPSRLVLGAARKKYVQVTGIGARRSSEPRKEPLSENLRK